MNIIITADTPLKAIENEIRAGIQGLEYWGDLPVTRKDYDWIKVKLKTELRTAAMGYADLCRLYPCTLTTFLVFLCCYEFNTDFWGLIGKTLTREVGQYDHTVIGDSVRATFDQYKFDYSSVKDDRRKNLAPILYEAGYPPMSCLDDLFYVLKYDRYSVFDPRIIVEDLCESRSYQIRKPLMHFLRRFPDDRAPEYVQNVHEAMLAAERGDEGELFTEQYREWSQKEEGREKTGSGKNQTVQSRPFLTFENARRGLCMVLPHTVLNDEWVESVQWAVSADGEEPIIKEMNISGGSGKRFVSQLVIAVRPAQQYKVTLADSEGLHKENLAEFTVSGVKTGDALLFNDNGRMISKNSLPYQGANLLLHGGDDCVSCRDITLTRQAYPTDREGYAAYYVEPCGNGACLSIHNGLKTVNIEVSREISLAFRGKKLFSLKDGNLYVEPPMVYVRTDADTATQGYEIRIGENKMEIGQRFENGIAAVALNEVTGRTLERYGTYPVSLYRNGKFIKQAEFCYVPDFRAEGYTGEPAWPDENGRNEKRAFRIKRIDNWDIELEEGGVIYPDARYYSVECRGDCGSVKGKLRHNEGTKTIFECSFEMPVSAFAYTLTNGEQENTKRTMDVETLTEERWWVFLECSGDYKQDTYAIRVCSVNGIEQEAEFKLSAQGCGNFDLSAFADTLKMCPKPAKIMLCHKESGKTATLFMAEKQADLRLQPTVSDGKLYVYEKDLEEPLRIIRFGAERFDSELTAEKGQMCPKKNKKGNIVNLIAFSLPEFAVDGIYIVRDGTGNDDIFGFVEQEPVFPDNSKNTFLVDTVKMERIGTVSEFIRELVREVIRAGESKDIDGGQALKMLDQLPMLVKNDLQKEDYEKLIALAFFAKATGSNLKKEQICGCMRAMAKTVLNGKDRMEIVRALVQVNAPEEVFDFCLAEYGLLLFERGHRDTHELAELLEANCPELALMLLAGADAPIGDVFGHAKLREIIGGEAMMEMICVPGAADEDEKRQAMREFIREQNGRNVRISVTSKLTGDMDDIQKMFEQERNKFRLNLSKKPEDGIYFDHIKYVDQYLNWYFGCHDADLHMVQGKKERMVSVMTREKKAISDAFRNLKKTQDAAVRYEKAISARCRGHESASTNWENPPMYFYLQGLAAYIVNLPERDCPEGIDRSCAMRFMLEASDIAPRISKRDLVLAAVYQYLIRKEESLCR